MASAGTAVATALLQGTLDALHVQKAVWPLVQSPDIILTTTLKTFAINAALILGSEGVLVYGLLPLVRLWGDWVYGEPVDPSTWLARSVDFGCCTVFYLTWLLPIWGLVWATNLGAYQSVASTAFDLQQQALGQPRRPCAPPSDEHKAAEVPFRFIFFFIVLAQKYAVQVVPWVGRPVAAAFSTLLCSLYAFEYAWSMQGVSVPKRLMFIEENWAYFVGFGAPTVLLTFFLPLFVSLACYAMVFPFCIVLATASTAKALEVHKRSRAAGVPRLPVFTPSFKVMNRMLRKVDKLTGRTARDSP